MQLRATAPTRIELAGATLDLIVRILRYSCPGTGLNLRTGGRVPPGSGLGGCFIILAAQGKKEPVVDAIQANGGVVWLCGFSETGVQIDKSMKPPQPPNNE